MSNYKETSITGTKWVRCGTIQIVNPYQRTPAVQFIEEQVTSLGEGEEPLFAAAGSICVQFDPAKVIQLRDPITGNLLDQTITYGEVYAMLYSAYMDAAEKRDAVQPEVSDESTES